MTLDELIERMEKAEGPDREVDDELWQIDGTYAFQCPHYTASLDAIVGLIERVFPVREWTIVRGKRQSCAHIITKNHNEYAAEAQTPELIAIATCLAFMKAFKDTRQKETA